VGADVAKRTAWRRTDLRGWSPAGTDDEAAYDLVTSHFFHLPDRGMHDLVPVLAAAVAPGGTLLVVHHADLDREALAHGHDLDDYVAPEDVRALAMRQGGWDVVTDERRERRPVAGAGAGHLADLVVRLHRR
jgi:hypothetical protein